MASWLPVTGRVLARRDCRARNTAIQTWQRRVSSDATHRCSTAQDHRTAGGTLPIDYNKQSIKIAIPMEYPEKVRGRP